MACRLIHSKTTENISNVPAARHFCDKIQFSIGAPTLNMLHLKLHIPNRMLCSQLSISRRLKTSRPGSYQASMAPLTPYPVLLPPPQSSPACYEIKFKKSCLKRQADAERARERESTIPMPARRHSCCRLACCPGACKKNRPDLQARH